MISTTRSIVASLATCVLALSGCGGTQQPKSQPSSKQSPQPPVVSPTPSTRSTPRSIMQPEVQPTSEPAPPAPLDLTIHFPDGGSALDDAARNALDDLFQEPVIADGGRLTLRGATDSKGDDAANLRISRERAEAVAAYLEAHGIDADRITVVALGEGRPAAPNVNLDGTDNPAGREANRRVDVHVEPGESDQPPSGADVSGSNTS